MRTLGEITDDADAGKQIAPDEAVYAICALLSLMTFDDMSFRRLYNAETEGKKPFLTTSAVFAYDERFKRVKKAMSVSPKQWLGDGNDPMSAEVQARKKSVRNAFARFCAQRKALSE